jgi:aminopeptidase
VTDDLVETLAEKTVDMLSVSPGQVIWIWTSTHSLDLLAALAFRIRERGAFWSVRLSMEGLLRRVGEQVPDAYLGLIPEHELRWLDDVDAIVEVRDHGWHIPGVPLARRRAMGAEWIALIDAAAQRGCRRITVVNPTPALASAYGVPLATLRQAVHCAVGVDGERLDQRQERFRTQLAAARAVQVRSALGTDLRLRVGNRPVHVDRDSLPRGEVYVAPLEDSADGVVVIDRAFLRGAAVERLRLTFARGCVVKAEAPEPGTVALFEEVLAASSGDKDVIAEFGMGLNPGAVEPLGDAMLDEKIGGSVHIALGMNQAFGGQNRSNLHLDLLILRASVWFDGAQVVEQGRLVV